jgi:hypothetical protein
MHSTNNLEDGYIGSGTYLWHSIKKHGRENFKLEILEFCSDREILKIRETELITEDLLKDPMCMNLKTGGEGGGGFFNESHRLSFQRAGQKAMMKSKNHRECNRKSGLTRSKNNPEEFKALQEKATIAAAEANKSKMWITDGILNKKLNSFDEIPEGWQKGRTGNFVNKRYLGM